MKNKIRLLLFTLVALIPCITQIKSGLVYDFGMGFWGPNAHDGLWHVALINQIKTNVFNIENPVFSGNMLTNYHIGYDLLLALISKLTGISALFLNFQLAPVTIALLLTYISYKYFFYLTKSTQTTIFFITLSFFSSSLGWIVTLIKNNEISGESMFWSMQPSSYLLNPPYALSLIFLLLSLYYYQQKKYNLLGLFIFLTTITKTYGGILLFISLGTEALISLIKDKKINKLFITLLSCGLLTIIFMYQMKIIQPNSVSSFNFEPFWFLKSMVEAKDRLFIPKVANLYDTLSYNTFDPRFIALVCLLFLVFLVGNFGIRLLGLFYIKPKKNYQLLLLIAVGVLIPTFFTQKGTSWNTIQFVYYSLYLSNIFFAKFLANLFNKNKTVSLFVLLISIFPSFFYLKQYTSASPSVAVTKSELESLAFLSKLPYGTVMTYPFSETQQDRESLDISIKERTPYVSALSHKPIFFEDINVGNQGIDPTARQKESKKFFETADKFYARGFLINNNISYLYLVHKHKPFISFEDLQVDKIYENQLVAIYKVRK